MSKILFRGEVYDSADKMPADVRADYDKAVQMLPDRDQNGIPDLLESDNAPVLPPALSSIDVGAGMPPLPPTAKKTRIDKTAEKRARWISWVVFGSVLLCIGGFFLFVFGILSLMKSSGAYQLGLNTALASPTAQEILGTPIRDCMFVSGSVSEGGANGAADLSVSLSGPSHSGNLKIVATMEEGAWRLVALTLIVNDREYNLLQ
jgi:hypothetical protein